MQRRCRRLRRDDYMCRWKVKNRRGALGVDIHPSQHELLRFDNHRNTPQDLSPEYTAGNAAIPIILKANSYMLNSPLQPSDTDHILSIVAQCCRRTMRTARKVGYS